MYKLRHVLVLILAALLLVTGCSYRYYVSELKPLSEAAQGEGKIVADDGSVIFARDRLEIRMRPMTDDELNRQFSAATEQGINPFTFNNARMFRTNETPKRFTVFLLSVKNYEYPKIHLDPSNVHIEAENGRKYYALNFEQLDTYFRTYALGGVGGQSAGGVVSGSRQGNEYQIWQEQRSMVTRASFPDEMIFSGQEVDGFIVFEPLAPDVSNLTVHLREVAVRFDYRDEPTETLDVSSRFGREIGRVYPDGRRELVEK